MSIWYIDTTIQASVSIISNVVFRTIQAIIVMSVVVLEIPVMTSPQTLMIFFWSFCKSLILFVTVLVCLPSMRICVVFDLVEKITHLYLSIMITILTFGLNNVYLLKSVMIFMSIFDLWCFLTSAMKNTEMFSLFNEFALNDDDEETCVFSFSFPLIPFNSVPKFHYKECPICMQPFLSKQPVKLLPCGHYFHGECVDSWTHEHDICPLCKVCLS
ncbi:hypothetical protein EIN_327470 [Entamoeba invadens IP1]|uniref:RING-type domain-containing protein n=1 Tax=Entamoeba invadens IP1 TaxID=370355 RepID=A0A0A1TXL9_ENTIV|nr:hypothetical protein EIN_327470 [Entamoeba invadens IP1]ELP86100.1 hypothetical protein EIN_327470 [Entamoeba invadens IP1]|eukprot:XP_004185446.1 hypothetical protein EIN_327470 [Entamoeba invadens IP1]